MKPWGHHSCRRGGRSNDKRGETGIMSVIFGRLGAACTMMALAAGAWPQTPAPAANPGAQPQAPASASQGAPWDKSQPLRAYIPSTISPQAAAVYASYRAFILAPQPAPPKTLSD